MRWGPSKVRAHLWQQIMFLRLCARARASSGTTGAVLGPQTIDSRLWTWSHSDLHRQKWREGEEGNAGGLKEDLHLYSVIKIKSDSFYTRPGADQHAEHQLILMKFRNLFIYLFSRDDTINSARGFLFSLRRASRCVKTETQLSITGTHWHNSSRSIHVAPPCACVRESVCVAGGWQLGLLRSASVW